jgi:hypothetical protein
VRTRARLLFVAGLASAALSLTACAPKTIRSVVADPARYAHRAVTVRGEVVQSYAVLGRGAYQLRDETGRLWVVTDHGVPRRGTRVQVKGTVHDIVEAGSLIPDRGLGTFLDESSRKVRD